MDYLLQVLFHLLPRIQSRTLHVVSVQWLLVDSLNKSVLHKGPKYTTLTLYQTREFVSCLPGFFFFALIDLISCVRDSENSLGELLGLAVKKQRPSVAFFKIGIILLPCNLRLVLIIYVNAIQKPLHLPTWFIKWNNDFLIFWQYLIFLFPNIV